jgi:hypothetical protein
MTRFWAAAVGFIFVSTAQAAQPPTSCQGPLSDPEVYEKVKDAVIYTLVFNAGSESTSDKIFSDLAHWLEGDAFLPPSLYTRLQKIRSDMDSPQI